MDPEPLPRQPPIFGQRVHFPDLRTHMELDPMELFILFCQSPARFHTPPPVLSHDCHAPCLTAQGL